MSSNDNKNFIIALLIFLAISFGIDFFSQPKNDQQTTQQVQPITTTKLLNTDQAMALHPRVNIANDNIKGSVSLTGAVIDDIELLKYKESVNSDKPVQLLTPKGSKNEYYYAIEYKDTTNNEQVSTDTTWTISSDNNNNKNVVQLATTTKNGLKLDRTIKLDKNYLITITDKVTNTSNKNVKLYKSANLVRRNPVLYHYAVVHEGLIGNAEGKVKEIKYDKINKETVLSNCKWFGYSDPYWLCTIINSSIANNSNKNTVAYREIDDSTYKIITDYPYEIELNNNDSTEFTYELFVGPKDINILNDYKNRHKIDKFDMAIDFGWFFILTKPLTKLMGIMSQWFSNMGIVILLLTLVLRLLTYPLMRKSFVSMAKMRKVQPKIEQLKKLYSQDKLRMNQELMLLYKKEHISPLSGCFPMLLQAPIFFCLYKVFFISISMRHAPLFGWVKDLSIADQCYFANLFGLIDWNPPSILQIGLWPLIMGITMLIQQKLTTNKTENKTPEQKMQEKMMLVMPVIFTFVCSSFPVSVVVYWTVSNIIGILQQRYVNKVVANSIGNNA